MSSQLPNQLVDRDLVDYRSMFALSNTFGVNKVKGLEDALRAFVEPGMQLHFAYNQARPMAISNALVRVFQGTSPRFTVIAAGLVSNQAAMFSKKLLSKVIVSFLGENYPAPGPNKVMQHAIDSGQVQIENQSLLAICQRLSAGAFGFPFAMTRSLGGSSMATDRSTYRLLDDPFGGTQKIGAMPSLAPDITFIHALAADAQGNLLLSQPAGESETLAFTASRGVIATAERIVSPEIIRRHSHLVRVPGYRVLSVSEVPLGCHPYGLYAPSELGIAGYVEDYDFFRHLQKASASSETFEDWVQEWIVEIKDHQEYLAKLGARRLTSLKGGATPDAWEGDITADVIARATSPTYDGVDAMVVSAARLVEARVREHNYDIVAAGVGYANLAAWLGVTRLQQHGAMPVELVAEIGLYGYSPRPGEPFIFSNRNLPTCKVLTTAEAILGLYVSGKHNRCLAILGAAQIDVSGRINSSYGNDGRFLVGSGGANDIASSAREILAVSQQSKRRLVQSVSYVTSIGERVSTLITDLGVYEKRAGSFVLTQYVESPGESIEFSLERIRSTCGWPLEVADDIRPIPSPTAEELCRVRLYDPKGEFLRHPTVPAAAPEG
jgi:acyl CoA:acetate/3-ketoacid CoA transferase alpha subunit/acyl CoA:acetate/3-ketoacid CoA transferase beta subunit